MKTLRRFKRHHAAEGNAAAATSTQLSRAPAGRSDATISSLVLEAVAKHPSAANDAEGAGSSGIASGIYYVTRRADGTPEGAKRMNAMLEHVTLVVYGWRNVEPGTLSWVFPSVGAAVSAARAMKNAVKWAILAGRRETSSADLDDARAHGAVLIEEAG